MSDEREDEFDLVIGDGDLIDAVSEHVTTHLGEIAFVLHPLISEHAHIDVHVVEPTDERPWHTLVTSGMSARAMTTPDDVGPECAYLELTLALPPDWPVRDRDPQHHWPFRLLQYIGTFPHEYDAWVWLGDTISNGPTTDPFAEGTDMCAAVLSYPEQAGPEFMSLPHGDHTIYFLGVIPLNADELDFKLEHGYEALKDRLDAADITELLDPTRPSVT